MKSTLRIVVAVLIFAPLPAYAQAPVAKLPAALIASIDSAVETELKKQEIVGAAVGVIRGGEIVYLKGFGFADRERGIPATTQTVFNWASNSKPLAATLAMQLVEKKQLDLDADVRTYVSEFPDKGACITTRHLLTHQSGIPHYTNGQIIATERRYPVDRPFTDPVLALDIFNKSPLIFQPGEKYAYSSYAYVLLSAVIQRAGKEPFQSQCDSRIAKPLGLKSLQLDFETANQPNWSAGYVHDGNAIVRAHEEAHYWKHGAGGYKSDIADFACWAAALMNRRLLAEPTELLMWTPQSLANGNATNRGLGVIIDQNHGLQVSHNGKQTETATRMVLHPRAKTGIVVLCNCSFANVNAISEIVENVLNQDSKRQPE